VRRIGYRSGLWLLLAPFLVGATLLVVLPALASAFYAVTRYDGLSPARVVGLDVFRDLWSDPEVHDSLRATAIIAGLAVPLRVAGALGLAVLLHRRERLAAAGRVAAYAPVVTPDAATALVWVWVVNPVYGPVGVLAQAAGFDVGPLLLDPWGARLTIVAISTLALGEGFLVMLAARRELPGALYDVARAEGAGAWATFRRVTLPLLVPVLGLLVARDLAMSMQSSLVPTLLVTRAGPLNATKTLPALVYERGFRELRFGDAAALSLLLFALTAALVAVQLRVIRRWTSRHQD
jgi:multiple sugar transport system permease protein